MAVLLFAVSLLAITCQKAINAESWAGNYGTTPNLEELLMGRCVEYQEILAQKQNKFLKVNVSCDTVWQTFNKSLAFQDPCQVNEATYDDLFELIDNKILLQNNTMFWSLTRTVVHDYTQLNPKFVTLEDTFPGYLFNNLNFCSCKNCPGGFTEKKKCYSSCNPNNQFWNKASRNLAEKASGVVYVMLNSTVSPNESSYFNRSHFGKQELPTLGEMKRTKKIVVLLLKDLGVNPKNENKCGEKYQQQLISDAKAYNITNVQCVEDPVQVRYILCAKYPQAHECSFSGRVSSSRKLFTESVWLNLFLVTLLGYLASYKQ